MKDEYLLEPFEQYEYKNQNSCSVKVKGRLRALLQFWKNMCAYDYILEMLKNGYKIDGLIEEYVDVPFIVNPFTVFVKSNGIETCLRSQMC